MVVERARKVVKRHSLVTRTDAHDVSKKLRERLACAMYIGWWYGMVSYHTT